MLHRLFRRPLRKEPKRTGPYVIAANDFGTYCLPRKALHRPACQAVMRGEVYERETVEFLCAHASGDIVHGGSFFGDFLPALSRAYRHVWAFEPNSDSLRCAEITVLLNQLDNVTLRNSGMGRAAGVASLTTEREGVYLGGASFITDEPGDTVIETIDAVVPQDRHIGVIHLDVERYEANALAGAAGTIRRCRPIIVLETNCPVDGYRVSRRINDNWVLLPD